MSVEVIRAEGRVEAWLKAARRLSKPRSMFNLTLDIERPGHVSGTSASERRIDEYMESEGQPPLHTVAETIFPADLYRRYGLGGVLEIYPKQVYPALRRRNPTHWGTYAGRLLHRETPDGKIVNPLAQMLRKMTAEIRNSRTKKSCYEIGLQQGEYELPLYSVVRDGERRMGFPCLSHLSFKTQNDCVHLTALYRSHDYGTKVPGNLLGLSRLLQFVARETGQEVGTLVVHSSYAYLEAAKGRLGRAIGDSERILKER